MHPNQKKCQNCLSQGYQQIQLEIEGQIHNALISSSVVFGQWTVTFVQPVSRILASLKDLSVEAEELKRILNETFKTKNLRILCSDCQKLKLPDGSWCSNHNVDLLQAARTISHGLCPSCAIKALMTMSSFREFINKQRLDE